MSRYSTNNVVTAAAYARTIVALAFAAATVVIAVRCVLLPALEWLQPSAKYAPDFTRDVRGTAIYCFAK
ncbi:MAG TPA: hypothetical protein VGM03_03455 [Phycisphaerae bacterium]|jgi:hypothetical protein